MLGGEEAVRAFEKAGWRVARQKGSHVSMVQRGTPVILTIPLHRELDRGLLRALIRKAGLTVEEFTALLG
ncbi:type II toxin-antitoxin system HicA family toxin [Thermanaeromonas sp. C210]|uniref:type II toxin-antitoxin system HicA family toxin n=1 Tax=Thermanaeromonas sp. C210 TaxID=2731925 RepID=UPI00155D0355|nr:type II toxin-antitoxin system HicA family toxin [Thermanaeromonas sp. C210]GFN23632.1 addiction module toxin, HicA family protein [Thermanaeromonas sp. C210]